MLTLKWLVATACMYPLPSHSGLKPNHQRWNETFLMALATEETKHAADIEYGSYGRASKVRISNLKLGQRAETQSKGKETETPTVGDILNVHEMRQKGGPKEQFHDARLEESRLYNVRLGANHIN